jgi:MFS family permease
MAVLSGNDRSIAGFAMLGHGLVHWFETSIPIFLAVWLTELDVPVARAGLIVALGYAPFGLGALPAGILADRYGPKRLVLGCLAGMSCAFLLLAGAPAIAGALPVPPIAVIGLGLLCWGCAASIYHPAGLALISRGVEERGTVFAWHGMAGNAGIALGPFVAATLLIGLDWAAVAAILAVPGVLGIFYGLTAEFDPTGAIDDEEHDTEDDEHDTDRAATADSDSLSAILADSRTLFASAFALVFVLVAFEGLFYRGVLTYLPDLLQNTAAIGEFSLPIDLEGIEPGNYIYTALLVVGMAGQYAGGKLTDRVDTDRGLIVLFLLLGVLALAFVPATQIGLGAIVGYCVVLGFVLFAIQPFYQNAVALHTPAETRGLSYGYTYLGEFGLGAASVALGGVVLGGASTTAFFAMLAGFAGAGSLVAVVLAHRGLPHSELSPTGTDVEE